MSSQHAEDSASINQILAENLACFMRERGMTQASLAAKAGMGQTTVSLYLSPARRAAGKSGKEPSAKLAEVNRLAAALGVELWELLRPLSAAQREFYRSMEALIAERAAEARSAAPAPAAPTRKRQARAA
jgi:transcriptional regulator with XRE-family HTH domain